MSDRQIQATTARDPRFETTRDMLSKRYNGVMDPISDEAVQAVLDEMDAPHQFQPDAEGNPRWCGECYYAEDAYQHATEEDRRAFDAARSARER